MEKIVNHINLLMVKRISAVSVQQNKQQSGESTKISGCLHVQATFDAA
ncbi:hypothetical protein [Geothermobacter ehrlichii]|nr:hypothetical protein [Geothermobacter ehrlichii]